MKRYGLLGSAGARSPLEGRKPSSGLSLRIGRDGVHMLADGPFTTWYERCTGVCEAAKRIVKATRPGLED